MKLYRVKMYAKDGTGILTNWYIADNMSEIEDMDFDLISVEPVFFTDLREDKE